MRVRYSIFSILLITALVATVIVIVQQRWVIIRQSENLETAWREAGLFVVDNPKLVYVRPLSCPIPMTRRYRVHIPEGKNLDMFFGWYRGGSVSEYENFSSVGYIGLEPGDYVVTCYWTLVHENLEIESHMTYAHKKGWSSRASATRRGSSLPDEKIFSHLESNTNWKNDPTYPNGPLSIFDPEKEKMMPLDFFPKNAPESLPADGQAMAIWICDSDAFFRSKIKRNTDSGPNRNQKDEQ